MDLLVDFLTLKTCVVTQPKKYKKYFHEKNFVNAYTADLPTPRMDEIVSCVLKNREILSLLLYLWVNIKNSKIQNV